MIQPPPQSQCLTPPPSSRHGLHMSLGSQGFSWGPVNDMEDPQEHIPIGPNWALGVSH